MGIKLFRNSKDEEKPDETENAKGVVENEGDEMSDDAYVEMENGDKVPVSEMMAAYRSQKKNSGGRLMNADDEVDVDGERVSVKDLQAAYMSRNANENAEEPQDERAEDVVDETKQERGLQNATKKAPVKKNENFDTVKNAAADNDFMRPAMPETRETRLQRGAERYSRKVKQGGNA